MHFTDRVNLAQEIKRFMGIDNKAESCSTAELGWGCAYLKTEILKKSKAQAYYYIDRTTLERMAEEFTTDTGYSIDQEGLIQKGWLRIVMGMVRIPETIRAGSREADKVKGLQHEIIFLNSFLDTNSTKIVEEKEFKRRAKAYNKNHSVTLDLTKAEAQHLWERKGQNIQVNNVSIYIPVAENLVAFLFIDTIRKALSDESQNKLEIEITLLEGIINRHREFFPATPTYMQFQEEGIFIPLTGCAYCAIKFQNAFTAKDVNDKTGALLWEYLINDHSFDEDQQRLFYWYTRIILHGNDCHTAGFFSEEVKQRFLDAAMEYVLGETDLAKGIEEYDKIRFDNYASRLHYIQYYLLTKPDKDLLQQSDDAFEALEKFSAWDRSDGESMLIILHARRAVTYFLAEIISQDEEYAYKNVQQLLAARSIKPFLFWYSCYLLYSQYPNILAFLAQNEVYSSLTFSLLMKVKQRDTLAQAEADEKRELLTVFFAMITNDAGGEYRVDDARKAKIFFQVLLKTTRGKFKIEGNFGSDHYRIKRRFSQLLSGQVRDIFEKAELQMTVFSDGYRKKPLLCTGLVDELFLLISQYEPVDRYRNGNISLSFEKLDLLIYLLQLMSMPAYEDAHGKNAALHKAICQKICEVYLLSMNMVKTKVRDHDKAGEAMRTSVPSWSDQSVNIGQVDWALSLITLQSGKQLDQLLRPSGIEFQKIDKKYNPYNQFTAQKLRTHLQVLFHAFNKIYEWKKEYSNRSLPVKETLALLKDAITFYVTEYSVTINGTRRYDIFSESLERSLYTDSHEQLLPVIGAAMNRFNKANNKKIIRELVKSEQIIRSLILLEYVVSEEERKVLLNLILNTNIIEALSDMRFSDQQFVIQSLSKEKEFLALAEKALGYAEERYNKRRPAFKDEQDQVFIYKTKLLIAYQKSDKNLLEKITAPTLETYMSHQFSAADEKEFYRALLLLDQSKPKDAYLIFDRQLSHAKEDRPGLALNRFAAKIRWAASEKNKSKQMQMYHDSLTQWQSFASQLVKEEALSFIQDKIWHNLLYVYDQLEEDLQFDELYESLDHAIKMKEGILELRVKNLVRRNMTQRAESLLDQARIFHELPEHTYPPFIIALEKLTASKETAAVLQSQYLRIFRTSPEQLVRIIPDDINDSKTVNEFLLGEIFSAASQMLRYINSISEIEDEDKYSDLLMLALNGRLLHYRWKAINKRGGFPESGLSNPGEIDFVIESANQEYLAVCEALRLQSIVAAKISLHCKKVFNYDPARHLLFNLVYFEGGSAKFEKAWTKYKEVVRDKIVFPKDFLLKDKQQKEITKPGKHQGIRIAKAVHGKNTTVYHLFIDIAYRIPI